MKVKLLADIRENVKLNSLGKVTDPGNLKAAEKPGRAREEFKEGAVIEMSDASAQKYIDAGVAEAYVGPAD